MKALALLLSISPIDSQMQVFNQRWCYEWIHTRWKCQLFYQLRML